MADQYSLVLAATADPVGVCSGPGIPPNKVTLTAENIIAIMPGAYERGPLYLNAIQATLDRFQINTPIRAAHFLAQIAHESCELRFLKELWGPTANQLSYEGRGSLGNDQPGDGRRFQGRGLIQITGRSNYEACSMGLYGDSRLLLNPVLLEQKEGACLSAGWYWDRAKLNALADGDHGTNQAQVLEQITRRINGGLNGLNHRQAYLVKARAILKVGQTPASMVGAEPMMEAANG